ncbi:hypothetical protein WJT74_02050 [Sphingomicrobium sp. XHP0239]|uniref:hypothetical protein n=1 Tax=Sphingomicrobium maritimum TaxID=3133972 RepID=UPI0031CC56F0
MILLGLSIAPLIALANAQGLASDNSVAPQQADARVRRVIIRNQLVIRIPVRPRRAGTTRFTLEDGPRCLDSEDIVGARIAGSRSIDFLMRDKGMMRMTTDRDCPSLDFYGGFYVHPDDERLCARRDAIRTRMGSSCRIETFQQLRPVPAQR